eukprot:Selendium_serpulae@DN10028_c0_g1_i1.p1
MLVVTTAAKSNVATQAKRLGKSWVNFVEAAVVQRLLRRLLESHTMPGSSIGVITPYKAQAELIKTKLKNGPQEEAPCWKDRSKSRGWSSSRLGWPNDARLKSSSVFEGVQVSTVDAFQGGEREVIIMSCVRGAVTSDAPEFISDPFRVNVALSRARRHLVIITEDGLLKASGLWKKLSEICDKVMKVEVGKDEDAAVDAVEERLFAECR